MNVPECSRVAAARPPSWLNIEIHLISDELVARHRFFWLGLVVLAGGCIHDDGSNERVLAVVLHGALLFVLISIFWMSSRLWLKCALMLVGAGLSFVHRELPVPGVGYGFLSSSAHWPADLRSVQSLAMVFGLWYIGWFAGLIVFHFGERLFGAVLAYMEAWLVKHHILPAPKHPRTRPLIQVGG